MNVACPECESRQLYVHSEISSSGPYGPKLLPELGFLFAPATLTAVLCVDCGNVRFFADPDACSKAAKQWTPIAEA